MQLILSYPCGRQFIKVAVDIRKETTVEHVENQFRSSLKGLGYLVDAYLFSRGTSRDISDVLIEAHSWLAVGRCFEPVSLRVKLVKASLPAVRTAEDVAGEGSTAKVVLALTPYVAGQQQVLMTAIPQEYAAASGAGSGSVRSRYARDDKSEVKKSPSSLPSIEARGRDASGAAASVSSVRKRATAATKKDDVSKFRLPAVRGATAAREYRETKASRLRSRFLAIREAARKKAVEAESKASSGRPRWRF